MLPIQVLVELDEGLEHVAIPLVPQRSGQGLSGPRHVVLSRAVQLGVVVEAVGELSP